MDKQTSVVIKQLTTRVAYENKWMKVREDQIEFKDGTRGIYGVIEKPDFALIIPLDRHHIYLVKQYRYPIRESFWEFPQGSHPENTDIKPEQLAKDELEEETGLIAHSMKEIGYLYHSYGMCDQGFHIFLAQDLQPGQQQLEAGEQGLEVGRFSIKEFEQMVTRGEIRDAASVSAYGLLKMQNIL